MNYNLTNYFILSSSCSITKGAKRSLIQDFIRGTSNLISNEYFDLINYINRKRINDVLKEIDDSSSKFFFDFLNFMYENEYAFFVDEITSFPEKSNILYDEHVVLKDCIIEVEKDDFDLNIFKSNIKQLDSIMCQDIQLWFKDEIDSCLLLDIINFTSSFDFQCIEPYFNHSQLFEEEFYLKIIDEHPCISKICLFNAESSYVHDIMSIHENKHPMLMGQLIYISHPLSSNNCGIINFESLSFGDENQFRANKKFNSCLYKKLTIDSKGNLKNCPHLTTNSNDNTIANVVSNPDFQKMWLIKKDDIEICKDCEFRYNCNDCRAFTVKANYVYSKPLKCTYNPYTNEWA
ncbi:grasp-with-spasm system SPASM domain peptide maturase [Tenacibaculum tangerinum]|uniref:Grasp-with-spasm system SPASM domain peptide maturase n=1 Tax=Tenacibaculum tangerinum TaxID=3038772 RepID=A0ABY8L1J3_9FLAO|nr:grasp-with-spasm system SPASM domain peptide maturase [Tenacibaculum tangerinum]WGH75235.1 grasp-with-spasm system SPASM domain peptide maturase [Tenacibaculum tangerinum]